MGISVVGNLHVVFCEVSWSSSGLNSGTAVSVCDVNKSTDMGHYHTTLLQSEQGRAPRLIFLYIGGAVASAGRTDVVTPKNLSLCFIKRSLSTPSFSADYQKHIMMMSFISQQHHEHIANWVWMYGCYLTDFQTGKWSSRYKWSNVSDTHHQTE